MSEEVKARAEQALRDEIAPALGLDANSVEIGEIEDGIATIRLRGGCGT